jgi:hypothetical protein
VERFTREAQTLARLNHPNIVQIFDFGVTADGRCHILMECVDGVNLRQAMRDGKLSPEEAMGIVPQICEALQCAHDEGIVHRDIKPENILIDKRGRVKIADFGLARLLRPDPGKTRLTMSRQVMGTPQYMAPEQFEHPLEVDHRADIYALGVVFYEMLTGELPIGRFEKPSARVQVDVRLDEVVLRSLERAPERRYQSAVAVKTEVESVRSSPQQERARETTPSETPRTALPIVSASFGKATSGVMGLWGVYTAALGALAWGEMGGPAILRSGAEDGRLHGLLLAGAVASGVAIIAALSWWYFLLVKPAAMPATLENLWAINRQRPAHLSRARYNMASVVVGIAFGLALMMTVDQMDEPAVSAAQIGLRYLLWILLPLVVMGVDLWIASGPVSPEATRADGAAPRVDTQADVARRLRGPALGLVAVGILNVTLVLAFAAFNVWYQLERHEALNAESVTSWRDVILGVAGMMLLALVILTAVISVLMILGGSRMLSLRSRGLALTASWLAVLPVSPMIVLSLPVGVWALVVLLSAEGKEAFEMSRVRTP